MKGYFAGIIIIYIMLYNLNIKFMLTYFYDIIDKVV